MKSYIRKAEIINAVQMTQEFLDGSWRETSGINSVHAEIEEEYISINGNGFGAVINDWLRIDNFSSDPDNFDNIYFEVISEDDFDRTYEPWKDS